MLGFDSIIVLPILLLVAVAGGLISVATIVSVEAASRGCPICGVEFLDTNILKAHLKDHSEFFDLAEPAHKENGKRPGKAA